MSAPKTSTVTTAPAGTPGDAGTTALIQRVGVIGSGTMGAGIAELCAARGLSVTLAVSRKASLVTAPQRIAASLRRRVEKGRITAAERDAVLARISVTDDLGTLLDRQLVIEAVPEDKELKTMLFARLDHLLDGSTVLASTTSAISVTQLAAATTRPERVIGVHFFNPVVALPLVELIPTMLTSQDVTRRVAAFVTEGLGKQQIPVADRSGFVVNALLVPYLLAAIRMVEAGGCSADTVDRAMELGCAHPMGPLKLADLIGLDVVVAIANALYEEFKQPLYAPPPVLLRMVESGFLGKKSGRGFYAY